MAPTITISGLPTNGAITNVTAQPFSSVAITDSVPGDLVDATISFAAADGTLVGAGLSAGVVNGGIVTYRLSTTTPVALQTELQGLIFKANSQGAAPGTPVTTTLNLTVSDVIGLTPLAMLKSGVYDPISVATDAAGDVFVANYWGGSVEKFDASGTLVFTVPSSSAPYSVATDAAGDVFVVNWSFYTGGNSTVVEFNAAGALVRTLSNGIIDPYSVATDAAGDVFVANHGNNTVEEFDASGALVRTMSSGVSSPVSVATDAAGDVFVANRGTTPSRSSTPRARW